MYTIKDFDCYIDFEDYKAAEMFVYNNYRDSYYDKDSFERLCDRLIDELLE